ncbi:MAG: NUDIX hydrolase [Anaerolineae bacterium]|nr:NUDIX hydrolase [Anaerolineae bacterium]
MSTHILDRQTTHTTHNFKVQRVNVRLPDGRAHPYDLVDHAPAVTIVPVDSRGYVWFVRQFRVGAEADLLELPAGVLNTDEEPLAAAAREIREEIGQAAGQLQKIGEFYMAPGYCNEFMHVFLATDLRPDPLNADADEFIQAESMPVQQVYEMVARGELRDSKSLASLLLALPYLTNSPQVKQKT